MRGLDRDPMIQYIIINLLTKYDFSSWQDFIEILDEKFHYSKYGKEDNWTNTGKNKHKKAGSQSLSTCIPNMTTLACTVSQKSLTKTLII